MIRFNPLILVCFFIGAESLAESLVVESLENGQCWTQQEPEQGQGRWKIASFGDGQSLILQRQDILAILETAKTRMAAHSIDWDEDWEMKKLDLYLYCQGSGISLMMNIQQQTMAFCLHLQPTTDDTWMLSGIYPNHDMPAGPCEGQALGQLLVAFPSPRSEEQKRKVHECQWQLKDYLQSTAAQIRPFSSHPFAPWAITLMPELFYREKEVKETILKVEACQNILNADMVEYNGLHLSPGTYYRLTFPARKEDSQ